MVSNGLEILVLGASYGMLPGVKLSLAGHRVTFVARADEIRDLSAAPLTVRIPMRRGEEQVSLSVSASSRAEPRSPALRTPQDIDAAAADFVLLAMQEPHFAAPEIATLLGVIGHARRPCLSIMNLPPPPFLRRLGLASPAALEGVYTKLEVWDPIDPDLLAVASPDPQAVRLDPDKPNELTVTLGSNFKASSFASAAAQRTLQQLARDMSHLKVPHTGKDIRPPVALIAHQSPYVPLAKWPMVLTGNFRCLMNQGIRSIREAVHSDIEESRRIYGCVQAIARRCGAPESDLVAFDDYARAAMALNRPSSVARALSTGARAVERLDRLIQNLGNLHDRRDPAIDTIVETVDRYLDSNRSG